ncbi:MAG: endonuclease/exonuclease/phosphatase family protein [Candidatus Peribacteria bacterium]|jgi:endonuclease/exonuclease/phosphatase (EEP) superfamily protein YafD|nr:endonuclease/exonuclease/phosphatase family protein [Candidatus Peribacteria bacterium]
MLLILLIGIGLLGITGISLWRENFVAELAISFLPYLFMALIVLTISICLRGFLKKKKKWFRLLFLRSGILSFLYGSEFFSFYGITSSPTETTETVQGIKVYYANILYTNDDYASLQQQIDAYDPDVVALVEFSQNHAENMKDYFQSKFPYVNRNTWSTKLAGDVVFSKYPMKEMLGAYESGRRKYSYLRLESPQPLYIYLVHTSSPVSLQMFRMRNQQLKKLNEDFIQQGTKRSDDIPVVMLGDFNMTPWSAFYTQFEKGFSGAVVNVFRGKAPTFTWNL